MAAATAWFGQVTTFLAEVRREMEKVTWPDAAQLRQATIAVSIFVILIGIVIFVMDWIFSGILIELLPSLFGAG